EMDEDDEEDDGEERTDGDEEDDDGDGKEPRRRSVSRQRHEPDGVDQDAERWAAARFRRASCPPELRRASSPSWRRADAGLDQEAQRWLDARFGRTSCLEGRARRRPRLGPEALGFLRQILCSGGAEGGGAAAAGTKSSCAAAAEPPARAAPGPHGQPGGAPAAAAAQVTQSRRHWVQDAVCQTVPVWEERDACVICLQVAAQVANDAANEAVDAATHEAPKQAANEAANKEANEAANEANTEAANQAASEAANKAANEASNETSNEAATRAAYEAAADANNEAADPTADSAANGAMQGVAVPAMPGAPMTAEETRLAQGWYTNGDMAPSHIAANQQREKSSITRLIKDNFLKKTTGRNNVLSEAQVAILINHLERLIKKANGEYRVTWHMLKTSSRRKSSEATIARRLHEKGYRFYAMRHKPLLTDEDIHGRLEFGEKYQGKPMSWWQSHVHMRIDVKFFPVLLAGKARRRVAQSGTRGVIRRLGEGLNASCAKEPNPKLKHNTGAKGVHILAGVGDGEAARVYEGPILKALKAECPGTKRFRALGDDDPSGFEASKSVAAKQRAGIQMFEIPAHSPQLNACDCWPRRERETRAVFIRRLKRTAKSIPSDIASKSVGAMSKRCQRLVAAEGGQTHGPLESARAGAP
ncbi:unnamed protein product, partial [Prorocentrum cordatum]